MQTLQATLDFMIRVNPTGDARKDALRLDFNRRLESEFHGAKVTSDAGLLICRELDEAPGLTLAVEALMGDQKSLVEVRPKIDQMLPFRRFALVVGLLGVYVG